MGRAALGGGGTVPALAVGEMVGILSVEVR